MAGIPGDIIGDPMVEPGMADVPVRSIIIIELDMDKLLFCGRRIAKLRREHSLHRDRPATSSGR